MIRLMKAHFVVLRFLALNGHLCFFMLFPRQMWSSTKQHKPVLAWQGNIEKFSGHPQATSPGSQWNAPKTKSVNYFFLLERIVISLADYYMCCLCPWVGSWRWSCCFLLRLAISQSTSASKPVTGVHGFAARSGPLFLPLDLFSYRTLFEFILVCLNWWFSSYLSSAFMLTWFFAFILT